MTNPPVHCLFSEIWPIDHFTPNPVNPNLHPEEQLKLLAEVIRTAGWRNPIVVSTRSNLVVKGHGRWQAAKLAGFTEAPVEFQDYENNEAEIADMIADNRISELSEMDTFMLAATLREIPAEQSMKTGFTPEEFAALCAAAPPNLSPEERAGDDTPYFKFNKHNIPMTPEECTAIEDAADAYREREGTNFGFIRSLLKLTSRP